MTLPEIQLWQALRRMGLRELRVRRQHPIGSYILDFYVPASRLAIEVDGGAHDLPNQVAHNCSRDAWLAERGIRVLRFNAIDVLDAKRREAVLATIVAVVGETDARI